MANLPEKNIVTVSKVTSIPSNTNVFINANGEFVQASINDVVKASNVVNDATLNAVKEAIDNQFSAHSGKSILAMTSGGYATDFTAYGASSQKQYSGKNKYGVVFTTYTTNGVTFTYDEDTGYVIANGTATSKITFAHSPATNVFEANTQYIISGGDVVNGAYIQTNYYGNESGAQKGAISSIIVPENYFTNVKSGTIIMYFVVESGITLTNAVFKPMIRKATETDGTFEKYVGGVASPNPTYPQEILSNGHRGYNDGEYLQGNYSGTTGLYNNTSHYICNKNIKPCKPNDAIKVITKDTVGQMSIYFYDENKNFLNVSYKTGTLNEYSATAPTNAYYFNWAVNKANITPTTAMHICVTINGKYALIVKNGNKNAFDISKVLNTAYLTNNQDGTLTIINNYANNTTKKLSELADLIEGETYTLSFSSTSDYDFIYLSESNEKWENGASIVITKTRLKSYVYFYGNTSGTTTISNIQMELGTVATDYVPHESKTTYIPIAQPLRGIGEVKDEIVKVDGVYGVLRRIAERIFDDTANWLVNGSYANTYYVGANIGMKAQTANVLSSHYRYALANALGSYAVFTGTYINFKNADISSLDDWKAWVAENPITLQYELANETFTPFTDQTPFYSMKTFDGVTLISSDAEMEVEVPTSKAGGVASIGYAKGNLAEIEMQNIKTKLTQLQTAIVNA